MSGEVADLNVAIKASIEREAATVAAELKSGATKSDDVARRYLRKNSLMRLKGNFSEESLDGLRSALADAWDAGGSYEQVVQAIQGVLAGRSDEWVAVIAQTEMNNAYNVGRLALAEQADMGEKSWSADGTNACDQCQHQISAGWIPLDEPFPGGVMAPCLHEGCDCGMNFRRTSKADHETRQGVTRRRADE
jgi:hypothetical protein